MPAPSPPERWLQKPELRRLAVTHIHDLIAATVGATREALASAEGRGIRAARLRAIMADITANLEDGDLTVADVAEPPARNDALCPQLFESDGLTFCAFVLLDRRLSHAHRC